MLTKRIIPIIHGSHMAPNEISLMAEFYNFSGADELVLNYNVPKPEHFISTLRLAAKKLFVPLTVAGNISNLSDVESALASGADKVCLGDITLENPEFVGEIARKYGDQSVVVFINVQKQNGKDMVVKNDFTSSGKDVISWAKELDNLGVGELIIHSLDAEKAGQGYSLELLSSIVQEVEVPIVASGGGTTNQHFLDLYRSLPQISGSAASKIFASKEIAIFQLKKYLSDNGVSVRVNANT